MKDRKYWKGLEELNNEPEFEASAKDEFPEYLPTKELRSKENTAKDASRRDFLKLMGFSVAAVSLAACETPVKKAIPYVNKPEEIDPGIDNWYATSFADRGEYCGILVKSREGRPIKIEGNPVSITKGGVNARVQASVLDLYDTSRMTNFATIKDGTPSKITTSDADKQITKKLKEISAAGGTINIVTNTTLSPSTRKAMAEFSAKYPGTKVVTYDPLSAYGLTSSYNGKLPSYDFSKAQIIASFSCDFLGTWISPVEFAKQYAVNRKLSEGKNGDSTMSRHYQFESNMSLTGTNADVRFPIKPSEEPYYIINLYNIIAAKAGKPTVQVDKLGEKGSKAIEKLANDLWSKKGQSLVVSGSNDSDVQAFVAKINNILGNEGKTLDIEKPAYYKQGDDKAFAKFVDNAKAGKVGAVIFYDCNPLYNSPLASDLEKALAKVDLKVSINDRVDETTAKADYLCSKYHYLESWGDVEPKAGVFGLIQPTITPIFKDTRQAEENFLIWAGINKSYYDFVAENWKATVLKGSADMTSAWNKALHDGVMYSKSSVNVAPVVSQSEPVTAPADSAITAPIVEEVTESPEPSGNMYGNMQASANRISHVYDPTAKGFELTLHPTVALGDGTQANNPWLQELPDPVTKACWDNYVTVSIYDAHEDRMNLSQGDILKVVAKGKAKLELPVVIQPGQAKGTLGISLGYGRKNAGKLSSGIKSDSGEKLDAIGVNAYPFMGYMNNTVSFLAFNTSVTSVGMSKNIAQTQTHHTIMGRSIIQESTLDEYKKNPSAGRVEVEISTTEGKKEPTEVDIWKPQTKDTHTYENHHWGMVIDLNSCIGCSACMIGCQAENNVPVVGRDEILRRREMHWLRIDRYYSSAATEEDGIKAMENPEDNPQVVHQPMMCQHCNHAPCETVCPVLATTHSTEGLNQMTYNRCIGTRYCANNCPYKVRRFNWFSYTAPADSEREFAEVNTTMNTDLGRMVLNPDVTVRARGVMEKCSLCVQRIQKGKLDAKIKGKRPDDGAIQTACAQSCPTDAIVFGDLNNKESQISKMINESNKSRNYYVLNEINTSPNISYLTKIRNKA